MATLKAKDLAALLLQTPDVDVVLEDVAWVLTLSDVNPEMEASTVPLQRGIGIRIVYTRPDYDCINHDIDFYTEPKGAFTHPVLQVVGSNTE